LLSLIAMDDNWTVIVLAAGLGKRMRSRKPKALHSIAGWPMLNHVLTAVRAAFDSAERSARYVVVVGHGAEQVKAVLDGSVQTVEQAEQLGTGHAVAQSTSAAKDSAHVLVINADVPLISAGTIADLMTRHIDDNADLTFLTALVDDPRGQGRIRRDTSGRVTGIVEEAEADAATLAGNEVNAGVYCFRGGWLWPRLSRIKRSPAGEYYLTDLVAVAAVEGATVVAVPVGDAVEALGINDRIQLAQADAIIRERIRRRHMLAGVTIVDPATTYIDADVTIGMDTTIYPSTYLGGHTAVGEECVIGPGARVIDSTLGARCRVDSSVVEQSTLEDGVDIGPFSHLRAGAYVSTGSYIGNYAEVKNSRLGRNVKMGHFSYIGDAQVGDDVNIGAGTITCNFDGARKHRTVIGDGAFIGSDTMLIAPVEIGAGARTGAGSVVNHDVPPNALAVGVPARIRRNKERNVE
jgi:bifunctional UDP-N-acetylglucosamine pyrophosphorylase/glucosamine-1-phosphate N-acetyltransferase